jgi:hypothetical protein
VYHRNTKQQTNADRSIDGLSMHLSVRVQAVALHRQRTEHARVVREAAASGNGLKWDWLSGNACARGWAVAGGTSLRWAMCSWSHSSDTCTRRPNPIRFKSLSAVNSALGVFPLDRFRNIPIDSEHRNQSLHQPKPSGVLRASTRPPSPVRLKGREERAAATATESI